MSNSNAQPTPSAPPPLNSLRGYSHRHTFGDIDVIALCDGHVDLSLAAFPGLTEEVAAPLLAKAALSVDSFAISVSAFLVKKGDRTYLIDSGTGSARGDTLGHVPEALAAAGVAPEDIDAVVMTHLHVDHSAGLFDGEKAVFPNAELLVPEAEVAFWAAEDKLNELQKTQLEFAQQALKVYSGRTTQFGPGKTIEGIFEPEPLPGHTPGHTGFFIGSGADRLLIWADLMHVPALQVNQPGLGFRFDADPEQAKATRARILDMAASDKFAVTGAHVPFPGFARIERDGAGLAYVPIVTPEAAKAAGPSGRS